MKLFLKIYDFSCFILWKTPIDLANDKKIIELFRIYNESKGESFDLKSSKKTEMNERQELIKKKTKSISKPNINPDSTTDTIDDSSEKNSPKKTKQENQHKSSIDKRKDESLNLKSSMKPEPIKNKTKSSDNSNKIQDLSTGTIDDSSEKNSMQKTKQENQHKSSIDKRKDELLTSKSHKKPEPIRNKTKSSDNSNKIQDLSTETIDKLLIKKIQLGKGATSIVYKVKNIFTKNGYLCLKILNDEFFKKSSTKEEKKKEINWNDDDDDDFEESDDTIEIDIDKIRQLLHEYEILNFINHPNIVKVYGLYRGDSKHNPAILLEYCKFNLEQIANNIEDIYLVSIIYEICSAMKYVHQIKLIHRDLSIRNILINSEKHVKICDFGISKVIDLTTLTSVTHGIGTLAFMAPEIVNDDVKYTEKVDVYSFGVVMYFIVTKGQMPKFSGVGNYINLKMPSNINKLSRRLIKACWSVQPENRPSFKTLLSYIVENNFLLIDGIEEKIPALKMHLGLD